MLGGSEFTYGGDIGFYVLLVIAALWLVLALVGFFLTIDIKFHITGRLRSKDPFFHRLSSR